MDTSASCVEHGCNRRKTHTSGELDSTTLALRFLENFGLDKNLQGLQNGQDFITHEESPPSSLATKLSCFALRLCLAMKMAKTYAA
jgi:hypothetical protein